MNINAPTDTVIYKRLPQPAQSDTIILTKRLSLSTEWAEAVLTGPDSIISAGDDILISSRPASFTFDIDGETLHNLEDKSVIAFKHNNELRCTRGTMLLEKPEEQEEKYSTGGILLSGVKPKDTTVWLKVAAAGPLAGVSVGDWVLIKEESTAYSLEIDGKFYRNAGCEEIVVYKKA